jgi:Zn-dependent peptidase ImmA (M78 family)
MSTVHVAVRPSLFEWAIARSRREPGVVHDKFPHLDDWISGQKQPTFRQLEDFAEATYSPFGYMFFDEPPEESLPVADFRTLANREVREPSADLLETFDICLQRQAWYRDWVINEGLTAPDYVGAFTSATPVVEVASHLRQFLGLARTGVPPHRTWTATFRWLLDTIEESGTLVMANGVVGSNTHRRLRPAEFRGFALSDQRAPLIFVNAADTRAAQIFTLVHEWCHVWLGESAVSSAALNAAAAPGSETWCNQVAAETLVPLALFRTEYAGSIASAELDRIAEVFKVSTLVVLRRAFDAGMLSWDEYTRTYDEELERVLALRDQVTSDGGDFYNTHKLRVSNTFARALITDTVSGGTLHRDAFRLLGTRKYETFRKLGVALGVPEHVLA